MTSTDIVDSHAEVAGRQLAPLIVREPLERFLDARGLGSGTLVACRLGEGHSNITYLISRGQTKMVLRRPPRPPFAPTAYDVAREARLLRALNGVSGVRVPRVLAVGDKDILGV